ncbi:hypothetical protein [Desulfosporosinus lacus]|uniref:Uncharacterized protein n=1 Tax=Desulfosporosinus lacus DSM 15449 TaxID=1121420 RepID=A0A1M6AJ75_9FIRM|nr:hypothetical protein [Desulfosporosinus lacus]SHI36559.1 hypothetical protein SAMN02746098_03965 [Desulfosporosinus lacus DSM 15449]
MKFKKKSVMLVSFTVGTLLLATTALADIASKSGYDELKGAIKLTTEQASEKFDSFTLDYSMALKDNGKTLESSNETLKVDRTKDASENISSGLSANGDKRSSQSYSDKTTMIRVSESDPTYYVTEFTKERKDEAFNNPFKEEEAADIEKIVDAVVGSLKDHVVVTENPDGSKAITGSLTEVQIPSLVNAVASFQLKQEFNNQNNNQNNSKMPRLTKDVFVKEVKGSAKVNADGVMESILGTAVLSGKDEQGTVHEISLEALVKVMDINTTTVTKPDLTGKKVVKDIARYGDAEMSNPEKFVGKFKNDIIIEKDNKFIKVGERFVDITQIDGKSVTGRYYSEFKPEFEEYAASLSDFKFEAKFEQDQKTSANFEGTNDSGDKVRGHIYLSEYEGQVNFNIDNFNGSFGSGLMFNSSFSPVLD